MKSKVLILTNPLNHEGGVVNYYNLFLQNFKSQKFALKHQSIGSRNWVFYYPILKVVLYPFFYLYDMLVLSSNLAFDRRIKIVQVSPSMIPVSLLRDAIPIVLSKIFRKKVIVFYRGWRIETFEYIKKQSFVKYLFNLIYQSKNQQVVLASSFKNSLLALKKNQARDIIITTTAIKKEDIVVKDKQIESKLKILFLARIEGLKGANEIIKAICELNKQGELNNFKFTFVGHENELGYIEKLKKNLLENNVEKSKVDFKGRITGKEKFRQYSEHDVYLFPSYTEGCPTSVLEALASGLFCITTPVGALDEIIKPHKNGLSIRVENVDDIVSALVFCHSNRQILNNRLEISKEAINKFEITNICKKFDLIYNKIHQ